MYSNTMLTQYMKYDPNYETSLTAKMHTFLTIGNVKFRKHNKNTKSHIFEFLIKSIQSEVKPVCDRDDKDNLHQFQCHTV